MKKLKNISLFKIIIFSIISLYINNLYLYILFAFYFICEKPKDLIVYILVLLITLFINKYRYYYIHFGIVDCKLNNYYIIDKILYKTKVIADDRLQVGDIVLFYEKQQSNNSRSDLAKDILYYGSEYKVIANLSFRKNIYYKVCKLDIEHRNILLSLLYNNNNFDETTYELGFNLAIYYLFNKIYKKNKLFGIASIIFYSLIFSFNFKYYLIIIDFIISIFDFNAIEKFSLKLLLLYFINQYFYLNYSILITLLINLYNCINLNVDFKPYFAIIQSFLFGEINLLYTFFYKYIINIQVLILVLCIVSIFFPLIENILICLISIYNNILFKDLSIRGSLSILSFLIFFYLNLILKIKSKEITFYILLILLILPTNNPLGHISFIDVGQGDSILIKLPLNQGNILIDTGSNYNYYKLKKYLFKQGIYKIDYLIITHDDNDHNGNIDSLKKDFTIINIITCGIDINFNDIYLKYYDLGTFNNDNDNSLVYGTNINGLNYLFTGDISSDAERIFINKYGNQVFDILKVSHHGSNTATSNYFISNILPKFAIISTSGQYNHPSKDVLDTLDSYLVDCFITKNDGNIEFYYLNNLNVIKYGISNFVIINV